MKFKNNPYGKSYSNVYSTRLFIVIQQIDYTVNEDNSRMTVSHDVFLLKTPERIDEFKRVYREDLSQTHFGRRVKTDIYVRRYVY